MPDRERLVSTLLVASLLALLTAVLVAPIRTSGFATVPSRLDCLRRNFALPPSRPMAHLRAATATDTDTQVNALPSEDENEEQDRVDALIEPAVPFLIACPARKIPDRQLIAPLSIPSLYPLRC